MTLSVPQMGCVARFPAIVVLSEYLCGEILKLKKEQKNMKKHVYSFEEVRGVEDIRRLHDLLPAFEYDGSEDSGVGENVRFDYSIYMPPAEEENQRFDRALLLLHGLNERSWRKYESWAVELATLTGRPVILFPLAFHMNRTPTSWLNPRDLLRWFGELRKCKNMAANSTFANVVLSTRIVECPMRFYISGKESAYNVWQLAEEIASGRHPLFAQGTRLDVFAYSIGAFLAEVLFMADPDGLFDRSRLFLFMGGAAIGQMYGASKYIMDDDAFFSMQDYYMSSFGRDAFSDHLRDDAFDRAFRLLLTADCFREEREAALAPLLNRLRIVTLKKDRVIPTAGVQATLGDAAEDVLTELDFPFNYSHQEPFPRQNPLIIPDVRAALQTVMQMAAKHLGNGISPCRTEVLVPVKRSFVPVERPCTLINDL